MGYFPRHQESQRILDTGVGGDVHEAFIHDLCARFRGNVGAQISGWLSDRVDIGSRPWCARRICQGGTASIKERCDVRIVTAARHRPKQFGRFLYSLRDLAFGSLVQHRDNRSHDLKVAEFYTGQHAPLASGQLFIQTGASSRHMALNFGVDRAGTCPYNHPMGWLRD